MMFPSFLVVLVLLGTATALVPHFTRPASIATTTSTRPSTSSHLFSSSVDAVVGRPTELPDSLEDGAEIAAAACASFAEISGNVARCRVDFDTSAGDDTYTLLKSSTPFMQKMVTAICYLMIPGVQEKRQQEIMRMAQAKAELRELGDEENDNDDSTIKDKRDALIQIIQSGGVDPENPSWDGPKARVYFPDEGSAALARRDWKGQDSLVPACVEFSACGGRQVADISKDVIVFFFCPRASEAENVERILLKVETELVDTLQLTVFVNPILVDMGVTGFGMAGRLLRERLIEPLTQTYYLRTLPWGALTRTWPRAFSVWQEDETAEGGYKLISTSDRLPSNPEVEDIYDIENGDKSAAREGFGMLNALGDFVNGMMKL